MPNGVSLETLGEPIADRGNGWYTIFRASVAQLDRASVFGTEGWGFESLRAYWFVCSVRVYGIFF